MKRRKFIIGAGALFSGSAAAMGTSAFSAAEVGDRSFTVAKDGDQSAALDLEASSGPIGNYVEYTESGEIKFDATSDSPKETGLNKDSVFYFDKAFKIDPGENLQSNYGGQYVHGEYDVTIDDSNVPGVEFYVADDRDNAVNDATVTTKAGGGGNDPLWVGFKVDTSEISSSGNIGSISITIEKASSGT